MSENEKPEAPETEESENAEKAETRTLIEELEVAGNEVVKRVEELLREGNIRRLIIKHQDTVLLEVPMTIAAVAGAATVLISPVLAAIGALAALLTQVTIVVVRQETEDNESTENTENTGKKKVEVKGEDE